MKKCVGEEPNNVILDDIKITFIVIPKCGNTSIKTTIINMGYGDKKQYLWGLKYAYLKDIPDDYLKIALVRNPYQRAASLYADKICKKRLKRKKLLQYGLRPGMSFKDYCKAIQNIPDEIADVHIKSQYYFLTVNNSLKATCLVYHENLNSDWQRCSDMVYEHCGRTLPELPHLHKGGPKPKYDDECKELIYKRYKKDFDLLGYER